MYALETYLLHSSPNNMAAILWLSMEPCWDTCEFFHPFDEKKKKEKKRDWINLNIKMMWSFSCS